MEQVNLQKAQETQILDRMKEIVRDKEAIIQVKEGQIASLQRLLDSRQGDKKAAEEMKEQQEEEEKEEEKEEDNSAPVQPSFEVLPANGGSAHQKSTKDRPPSSRLSSARSAKSVKSSRDRPPSR